MASVRLLTTNKITTVAARSGLSRIAFSTSTINHKQGYEPAIITLKKEEILKQEEREARIMIEEPVNVSIISGVPEEHIHERLVKISKASKSAMQSGTDNTHAWIMQFDTRQRWENPLIGWCSNGDPLSNLQVRFNTKEEAMEFCGKNNWPYYIEKEKPMAPRKKSYAVNFSWNKRTRVSTK